MSLHDKQWRAVCNKTDLVNNSGVCVLIHENTAQEQQVALFWINKSEVHAIGNFDPFGKANVLYRGIVGSVADEPVVASPLYKQHFSLVSGGCVEDGSVQVASYRARLSDDLVELYC